MVRKPAKDNVMQFDAIVDAEKSTKRNRTYRAESVQLADDRIGTLVATQRKELENALNSKKMTLADAAELKERIMIYLRACEAAGTLPKVTGLARSCGVTRQAVYDYLNNNRQTESGKLLMLFQDLCLEALNESALRGDSQPVVSIFTMKSMYGLRESVELIAKDERNPYGEQQTAEDIAAKYSDIVIDEFSDD